MKILTNQTLYKCSYCGRKKLSKKGCLLHENEYCSNEFSPNRIKAKRRQEECKHEHKEMVYSYIPGEAVQQPDHEKCIDCNATV